jgi:hypothetical protein
MTASQEYVGVCSVLVEAWAPNSGKNPLSYSEWPMASAAYMHSPLHLLGPGLFRPPSRVGLVWELVARVLRPRSVKNSGREAGVSGG